MTAWQRRKIFVSTTWNSGCSSIKRSFQNKLCWEISNNHFPFRKIYLAATRQTSIINKWESVGFIVQSNDDITIVGNPDTREVFRYNVIFHNDQSISNKIQTRAEFVRPVWYCPWCKLQSSWLLMNDNVFHLTKPAHSSIQKSVCWTANKTSGIKHKFLHKILTFRA